MSEILPVLVFIIQLLNLVVLGMLIPFFKHVIELRLKIERIDVILNMILKDVEKLKKEIYNGKESED